MIVLTPGVTTLTQLERVFREQLAVQLDPACRPAMEAAQAQIAAAAAGEAAVYWQALRSPRKTLLNYRKT